LFDQQPNGTGERAEPAISIVGDRSLPDVLAAGAAAHPDRELLIFDPLEGEVETFTWAEVLDRSLAAAAALAARGVGEGDAVHLHMANCPQFLFAWFGVAHLGAKIVPTNTAAVAAELAYVLSHSGAAVSVADGAGLDVVRAAVDEARTGAPVLDCRCDLDDSGALGEARATVRPSDELAVMYTSGTTSRPKGVRVTNANYVYAGETVAAALRLREDDRFLIVLPLFHANAQYYSVMSTLVSGGAVILAARFSASRWADLAVRHQATVASLFAAPIRMILAQEPRPSWREHGLRAVAFAQNLSGGELARWEAEIGAPLFQLYGMTETIGPPLMNGIDGLRRHDSLGRPTLGYSCRIVRDDGSEVGADEPGELLVGGVPGVSLMAGYLKDPDATDGVLRDGWLATGDLVQRREDGLIDFVGRTRDMIKRAGENVAAGEVEEVLLGHPGVLDVAVIGVPDAIRDEQIVAFVVPAQGSEVSTEELARWADERLAKFRVPSAYSIESELPRTAVGKIQKHRLKEVWDHRAEASPGAGAGD
jgi:crotonobetaine/carnitine-CoA ligase